MHWYVKTPSLFMKVIPHNITGFLDANRVASVCFNNESNNPYCVPCFFVFDAQHRLMLFKSSHGAYHEDYIRSVTDVAGSVLPEQLDPLKMKGLQFTGKTLPQAEIEGLQLELVYYKKFPIGRKMPGYIWAIRPDFFKFTDNTHGFGSKTVWSAFSLQREF